MNLKDNDAWKQLVMATFVVTAIVAFFWFLWTIKGVLLPLFFACLLAYLLNPLVKRLEMWHIQRSFGALIAVILSILVVVLMALIPWPVISTQLQIVHQKSPELLKWLHQLVDTTPVLKEVFPNSSDTGWLAQLQSLISENVNVSTLGQKVWLYMRQGGSLVLAFISWIALMPILVYFILANWPQQVKTWRKLMPRRWRGRIWRITSEMDDALGQYMRGQVLLMFSLAAYYAVALKLIGLQMAIPLGLLTGLFVIVPYLGFGVGLILSTLTALMQFGLTVPFFLVLGVYGVGQLLESYVLTPRLVGERIGLSPVAVIVALMVFSALFGFVGMLLALPVSAVLMVVTKFVREWYFKSDFYRREVSLPVNPTNPANTNK